jgi:hypothetical protein
VNLVRRVEDRPIPSGAINLRAMPTELSAAFESAGISRSELLRIAGPDSVIRGSELKNLLSRVDEVGRSGKTADLSRAANLHRMIDRQLSSGTDEPAAIERRPATGLRAGRPLDRGALDLDGATLNDRAGGAKKTNDVGPYRAPAMVELADKEAAPERANAFIRFLEFVFGWLPGVGSDDARLKDFGKKLADRHGSDLIAAEAAWKRQDSMRPRNAAGVAEGGAGFRDAMISQVASRMQNEQGLDADVAKERAATVVDAMMERHGQNMEADGARVSEVKMRDPKAAWAPSLASVALPVERSAKSMGAAWEQRYNNAMTAVPDDFAGMQHLAPGDKPRRKDEITMDRLQTLSMVMAMERSGQISNVPADAVDQLLALHQSGTINSEAVASTLSELQRMPAAERNALMKSINEVPKENRHLAYAVLAREHFGVSSNNKSEREGAMKTVANAAAQLKTMSNADAEAAFRRGTLGLEGPEKLQINYNKGGKKDSVEVPVYFHPGVSEKDREKYRELLRESYSNVPPALMRRMLEGEGGEPFAVQILPQGSIETDEMGQARPDSEAPEGGHYRPEHNHLRLNATELDRIMSEGKEGRAQAIGIVLHETAHGFDDISDASQNDGMYLTRSADINAAKPRVNGAGDLAPAYEHFSRMRSRFQDLKNNMNDRDGAALRLFNGSTREGDKERYDKARNNLAGRSGAVSEYGALGGDEAPKRNPRLQVAEWWAETYSNYLNPATRDRLKASDPVAFAAAEKYTQLIDAGVSPPEARTQALRYSLSTEVSAQQGTTMLAGAKGKPLADAQLKDLESIGDAFDRHQQALKDWKPFGNDSGLKKMRGEEAKGGADEGRKLLTAIEDRLSTAQPGSAEHKRLSALKTKLEASVEALDKRADALLGNKKAN